jgi:hypothetical protein
MALDGARTSGGSGSGDGGGSGSDGPADNSNSTPPRGPESIYFLPKKRRGPPPPPGNCSVCVLRTSYLDSILEVGQFSLCSALVPCV